MRIHPRLMIALLLGCPGILCAEDGVLVFSFFRNNGEDGLYLATSADGMKWTALHGDKPLLRPEVGESKLMRDPSILRGPDGTFHMVWTTSWQGRTIGYASSRDLRTWSPQRAITIMPDEVGLVNCWAPELFYDAASRDFVIVWASTIQGRFQGTLGLGNKEYNHRQYVMRTRDFRTFTQPALFYDPGFIVIDAALFRDGNRYAMVAKNETANPPAKYLFLTFADSLEGPWTKPSDSVSGKEWAEGPAPVRIGGHWVIYFDKYRDHRYGAIRSRDLRQWEDISDRIEFPKGIRHGTAFRAPRAIVEKLRQ